MNYQKHYDLLIDRAKNRNIENVTHEIHHVLPKSLGGGNEEANLVNLTLREHFIAHLLLAKIYGGKMITALRFLMDLEKYESKRKTSRLFEKVRDNALLRLRDEIIPNRDENYYYRIAKIRKMNGTYSISEEQRTKISEKISGELNGMSGKTHTDEARKIISEANKQQIQCPHCEKLGGIAIMQRWHFDFCKSNPDRKIPPKFARKPHSEEHKEKLRAKAALRKQNGWVSPLKGKTPEKNIQCPHCGKEGAVKNLMQKWHFDNCKYVQDKKIDV